MPLGLSLWCSPANEWGLHKLCYILSSKVHQEESLRPVSYQSGDSFTGWFLALLTSWAIKTLLTNIDSCIPLHWLAISVPKRGEEARIQLCQISMKPVNTVGCCRL